MQKEDFIAQAERLKIAFGEKAWNEEKVKLLWEKFKLDSDKNFRLAVDHVIAECQFSPPISKIAEQIPRLTIESSKRIYNYDCSWCGQSGLVRAQKKNTNYRNTFICPCSFGLYRNEDEYFKKWNSSYSVSHELDIWATGREAGSLPEKIMHSKD